MLKIFDGSAETSEARSGPDSHTASAPALQENFDLSLLRITRSFANAIATRGRRAVADQIYASALWRQTLGGPAPDRILYQPKNFHRKSLANAQQMLNGRWRLKGGLLETQEISPFFAMPPSESWAEEAHSFGWLRHLESAATEQAREKARHSVAHWLRAFASFHPIAWRAHVTGRRIISWLAFGRFLLADTDVIFRSQVLWSLARQARHLSRTAASAPDGLPRLTAWIAVTLSGLCLPDGEKRLAAGAHGLAVELGRQILSDGAHISRNPEALCVAMADLLALADAYRARDLAVPVPLRRALDRMAPALRYFLHGDGQLALFNGGTEGPENWAKELLAFDDAKGKPLGYSPHAGFHRLSAEESLVLIDAGAPPPASVSREAHAGTLSFEFSRGVQRIIVNCGTAPLRDPDWQLACRATAAHSTVTVADTSSSILVAKGWARSLIGAQLLPGPRHVENSRQERDEGQGVAMSHDGYMRNYGVRHQRSLFLSPDGLDLRGEDVLSAPGRPRGSASVPIAARFHLHPSVKASLASDRTSVMLQLPDGEGWRFRAQVGELSLAESIYCGDGSEVRRSEQILIEAKAGWDEPASLKWALKRIEG
jgi:uncharacterized heparinase superfamily protein